MKLEINVGSNIWLNAGIVNFYLFHRLGLIPNQVSVQKNREGIWIEGEEIEIISYLHQLMPEFLRGNFYQPEQGKEICVYDGKKIKKVKGPARAKHIEVLFPSINKVESAEGNIEFDSLSEENQKVYQEMEQKDAKKKKPKSIPILTKGHLFYYPEFTIKSLKDGKGLCSCCGRNSDDVVNISGNNHPLNAGQSGIAFNSGRAIYTKVCSLCRYLSLFAVYGLFYSHYQRGRGKEKEDTVHCFIPFSSDFESMVTAMRAFLKDKKEVEFTNYKTPMTYLHRVSESYFALLYGVAEELRRHSKDEEDFLGLDMVKLAHPEVFYLTLTRKRSMGAIKSAGIFHSSTYIFELIERGSGIDWRGLYNELMVLDPKIERRTLLRNVVIEQICQARPVLEEIERIVLHKFKEESNLSFYNTVKFIDFYLKEVMDVDYDKDKVMSFGKSVGEGCARKGQKGMIYALRQANSLTQFLEALMKVYGYFTDQTDSPEFYWVDKLLEQINIKNWRDIRAYMVITAINQYLYKTKDKNKEKGGERNG